MKQVGDPLEQCAALAWRLAPQLCRPYPEKGRDCSWLHRFWPCLRLVGVAATPERHADFYREAFERVPRGTGSPRVLVCGAADYAMVALVIAAFRNRAIEPAIGVIDVCETPLRLCRWYGEREGCSIEAQQCSVLEYSAPAEFDVICTHSFFGQFTPAQRPAMLDAWRRLLRPGGLAITTLPLRPGSEEEANRFSPGQADALREAVRARADALARSVGAASEEILRQAEIYLAARYGYAVNTGDEVRGLLERAGFEVLHADTRPMPTEEGLDAGGPGLRLRGGRYFSVVAVRR